MMKKLERCNRCGKTIRPFESNVLSLDDGSSEILCMKCANADIAERAGIKFEHPDYLPIKVTDDAGIEREFHFITRLLGDIVSIDAVEIGEGEVRGYEFSVIGDDPEKDTLELYRRLVEKIKRSLAIRHLEEGDFGTQIAEPGIVRARISSDPRLEYDLPLLIIDGKEISWAEFGRMILTYEGFQFKLEIFDRSEEP